MSDTDVIQPQFCRTCGERGPDLVIPVETYRAATATCLPRIRTKWRCDACLAAEASTAPTTGTPT